MAVNSISSKKGYEVLKKFLRSRRNLTATAWEIKDHFRNLLSATEGQTTGIIHRAWKDAKIIEKTDNPGEYKLILNESAQQSNEFLKFINQNLEIALRKIESHLAAEFTKIKAEDLVQIQEKITKIKLIIN